MVPKLTKELADALHANDADGLEVIDPETGRIYLIVDEESYRETLSVQRHRHDRDAIAEGLAQLESGEARPASEAFEQIRERLGFPEQQ